MSPRERVLALSKELDALSLELKKFSSNDTTTIKTKWNEEVVVNLKSITQRAENMEYSMRELI